LNLDLLADKQARHHGELVYFGLSQIRQNVVRRLKGEGSNRQRGITGGNRRKNTAADHVEIAVIP
jgi:hypothetical protein